MHLFLNFSFTLKLFSRFSFHVVFKYAVVNGSVSLEQCVFQKLSCNLETPRRLRLHTIELLTVYWFIKFQVMLEVDSRFLTDVCLPSMRLRVAVCG